MRINFRPGASPAEKAAVRALAASVFPTLRPRADAGGLELSGVCPAKAADAAARLENLAGVASVSLAFKEACPRVAAAGPLSSPLDFTAGFRIIAGPCAVEDERAYLASAQALKAAGAHALRAALFKPRSSPYAFQGLGFAGLKILEKAKKLTGLPLVTEVTDPRQVARLAPVCGLLQIGARNMRNYELLKEAGRSGLPALLKRAMFASLRDWLLSAEYLLKHGAGGVALCERGDAPLAEGGPGLDFKLIAAAKKASRLPVLADPSHAARDRRLAERLALAAARRGADGLLIEASLDPLSARVDGRQTLSVETFSRLAARLQCEKN